MKRKYIKHISVVLCATLWVASASGGEIVVSKVPGGYINSIEFTDASGKVIKRVTAENQTEPGNQFTTATGAKINRRVELLGNSNYALVAEYTWPAEATVQKVSTQVTVYNAAARELYELTGLGCEPKALSDTGVFVCVETPPEEGGGTPGNNNDTITVYDKTGSKIAQYLEPPFSVSQIKISPNAKWLVYTALQSRPSRQSDLVLINLETQQIHRQAGERSDPVFSYHKVLDDGSLIKVSDVGGPASADGTVQREAKTIVLRKGMQ